MEDGQDALFWQARRAGAPCRYGRQKVMHEYGLDLRKHHPEGGIATGMGIWQQLCKPGADIRWRKSCNLT